MKKLFLNFCIIFELICTCMLILVWVHSFFFSDEPAAEHESYYPVDKGEVTHADSLVLKDSLLEVSVYDQGLQIWQGSYRLPPGWQMQHDVATDTLQGDHYKKFKLSFYGPQGEIIKSLGYSLYKQLGKRDAPTDFVEAWQAKLHDGQSGLLDTYEVGEPEETAPHGIHYLSAYLQPDSRCQYFQAHLRGQKDGQDYEGIVRITNISPELDWINDFCMSVTLCPSGLLQNTLATEAAIAGSYEANPAYLLAKNQHREAYLQGNAVFTNALSFKCAF